MIDVGGNLVCTNTGLRGNLVSLLDFVLGSVFLSSMSKLWIYYSSYFQHVLSLLVLSSEMAIEYATKSKGLHRVQAWIAPKYKPMII